MASGNEPCPLPIVTNITNANNLGPSIINIARNMTNVPEVFGNDVVGILNFPVFSDGAVVGQIQLATVFSQSNSAFTKIYKRRNTQEAFGDWFVMS